MKKKKKEFSKSIVNITYVWAILCVTFSYVLAWFGMDTNSTVTDRILIVVVLNTLGYLLTKAFEKNSRNRYRIDENGVPYDSGAIETPFVNDSEDNEI